MATHIINTDPAALRAVEIPGGQSASGVVPTLAVGEIVKVLVRQNQENAQGLIALRGSLLPATLPTSVESGDLLLAKVTSITDAIVLKILDVQSRQPLVAGGMAFEKVATILKDLVHSSGPYGLRTPPTTDVASSLQNLAATESALREVFLTIATPEGLSDAGAVLRQLRQLTTGEFSESLRDIAQTLRSLVSQSSTSLATSAETQLLQTVLTQLQETLRDSPNLDQLSKSLQRLAAGIEDRIARDAFPKHAELMQHLVRTLYAGGESSEGIEAQLRPFQEQLSLLVASATSRAPEIAQRREQIEQLAQRFEQLATLYENLARFSPVMQALGEPALILFPFIAQGLLNHSEVRVTRKNEGEASRRKQGKHEAEAFQRVQISVPLPTLGSVFVDVAHRGEELFARFTVADEEVGRFLLAQLERLVPVLREQGFARAELTAHVGHVDRALPNWAIELGPLSGTVA